MLLVLTGDVQTGKTRWLQQAVSRLEEAGVVCEGVLAPGIWAERGADAELARETAGSDGAMSGTIPAGYEKLGIDNELLPGHERVRFALREDIARSQGEYDPGSQAARERLSWHIDDRAIERVNDHLAGLLDRESEEDGAAGFGPCRVLVIDELGRLELMRGEGLTNAVELARRGPRGRYDLALVVVREMFGLCEMACETFGPAWGGAQAVMPDETTWERWLSPLASFGR